MITFPPPTASPDFLPPDLFLMDNDRLGDEIARLAAHLHAATHRLLVLVRTFDEREGWGQGFVSCAAWLSWRTGIGPGPAREKVRVARALGSLPEISRAMAGGQLSYSKVRALTRVATPENEGDLLELARHATAAHIEKLVRSWRRADRLEEAEAEESRHQGRALFLHPDEDGGWVLRGRLDPEVGALLQKALEQAGETLYRQKVSAGSTDAAVSGHEPQAGAIPRPTTAPTTHTGSDYDPSTSTAAQRRADALGLLAERALAGGGLDEVTGSDPERPSPSLSVSRADRFLVVLHVDAEALRAESETGPGVLAASGTGVSAETSRRLACDAGVVEMHHDQAGGVLDVGRKRRTVPPAIRRALEHRDAGCRFPGCGCRYTDAHHIVHWADGGETRLDNLVLLCSRHHRAVHEGGFRVEVVPDVATVGEKTGFGGIGIRPPGFAGEATGVGRHRGAPGWRRGVRIRFHGPDGRLIPEVPDAPVLPRDPVAALELTHRERGVDPGPWTPTPLWHGEIFDYGLALDMVRHPLARERQARQAAMEALR